MAEIQKTDRSDFIRRSLVRNRGAIISYTSPNATANHEKLIACRSPSQSLKQVAFGPRLRSAAGSEKRAVSLASPQTNCDMTRKRQLLENQKGGKKRMC
jgi:hypothetical protein